ncbi:phospholipase A1-II 1-like, partial [Pistacia vera]|uniref:phospholipase A1-II 1-like n=1 Tax=Pistacia vera TaxID=55513 RepID=UPI001263139D
MDNQISGKNWKDFSGEKNWEGLLKPLARELGIFINICGEGIQAIYDFVHKDKERRPTHEGEDLFSELLVTETDDFGKLYTVTDYLYAMSDVVSWIDWIVKDRYAWIGYVAVATDEGKEVLGRRDIMICWRGTIHMAEWLKNLQANQISASKIFQNMDDLRVHEGFLSLYTSPDSETSSNISSARNQVLNAVNKLLNKPEYKNEEISITVTGHSLGAALATLNAADMVANKHNERTGTGSNKCMVTAIVFASPEVGNEGFRKVFHIRSKNLHLLRIENRLDIVTDLPISPSYKKVGVKLKIKSHKSAILNLSDGLQSYDILPESHTLEQYMEGVRDLS